MYGYNNIFIDLNNNPIPNEIYAFHLYTKLAVARVYVTGAYNMTLFESRLNLYCCSCVIPHG